MDRLRQLKAKIAELGSLETRREHMRAWLRAILPQIADARSGFTPGSLQSVEDQLNANDIPARRGGRWSRVQVLRLLAFDADHATHSRAVERVSNDVAEIVEHFPGEAAQALSKALGQLLERHQAGEAEARALASDLRAAVPMLYP